MEGGTVKYFTVNIANGVVKKTKHWTVNNKSSKSLSTDLSARLILALRTF